MESATCQIEREYQERVRGFTEHQSRLQQVDRYLGQARVGVFLAFVAALAMGMGSGGQASWFVLSAVLFLGFLAVITWHEQASRGLRTIRLRRRLCEEGLARRARDWQGLSAGGDDKLPSDLHLLLFRAFSIQ